MNLNTQKKIEIDADFQKIGYLGKPIGKFGELKLIHNELDFSVVSKLNDFFVLNYLKLTVESIRSTNKGTVVKFYYYNNKNQAELLSNQDLFVLKEVFLKYNKPLVFSDTLVGAKVFFNNKQIAVVTGVLHTGANDVLELNYSNKEVLIPVIDEVIIDINYSDKIVKVNNIEEYL